MNLAQKGHVRRSISTDLVLLFVASVVGSGQARGASEGPASLQQIVARSEFVAVARIQSAEPGGSKMKFSATVLEMWKGERRSTLEWDAFWPPYCLSTDFVGARVVVFLARTPGGTSLEATMNYVHLPLIGDVPDSPVLMSCVHVPKGVKPSMHITSRGWLRSELFPLRTLRSLVRAAAR